MPNTNVVRLRFWCEQHNCYLVPEEQPDDDGYVYAKAVSGLADHADGEWEIDLSLWHCAVQTEREDEAYQDDDQTEYLAMLDDSCRISGKWSITAVLVQ
jgi:hypothetical protein